MRFDRHDEIYHLRHTWFFRFFLWGVRVGAGAEGRHFGNQNLKNRKLKRKRKQKRKRGNLREGREAPRVGVLTRFVSALVHVNYVQLELKVIWLGQKWS